jgi:hypothetical protein
MSHQVVNPQSLVSESSNQETTETQNTQNAQPTNTGGGDVLAELREQNRLIMQQMGMMQQQLQATQNYSAPAPVVQQPVVQQQPEQSFSYDDFVNDPAKVIQAQIQRSLNPLQQSLQSMTRTTHYQNVIRPQVAAHPNVAPHWDRIAGIVDNYIQSQVLPNRDVTQQDLEFAVTNAIGRMAMQGNFGQQQQQQQTTQQTTQQVPPTTRPSVAPLPSTATE